MKSFLLFAFFLMALPLQAQERPVEAWQARSVEVTVPAVVTAGEEFPVVYRATPRDGVRLEATFETKSKEGKIGQGRITDEPLTASRRIRKAVIDLPGYYRLTFKFKNDGNRILQATARTKVVSVFDRNRLFSGKGQSWDLPHKNLYFAPSNFPSWSATPKTQREMLGLERVFFQPLLEQPDYDDTWWPLRSWNELHEILQPRFVPPLSLVHAFVNSSYLPTRHVSYAAWSQDGLNLIYQSEVGGTSWFYIETPATATRADLNSIFIFHPTLLKPSTTQPSSGASWQLYLARSMARHRATDPDASLQAVNIWLVQIRKSTELDLRFPGYRVPERPRF